MGVREGCPHNEAVILTLLPPGLALSLQAPFIPKDTWPPARAQPGCRRRGAQSRPGAAEGQHHKSSLSIAQILGGGVEGRQVIFPAWGPLEASLPALWAWHRLPHFLALASALGTQGWLVTRGG